VINDLLNLEEVIIRKQKKLTRVIISNCPKLKTLVVSNPDDHERGSLYEIKITNCPNLEKLVVPNNNLTNLDIRQLKKLKYLGIENNKFASSSDLDLSHNLELEEIYALGNYEEFKPEVSNLPKLKKFSIDTDIIDYLNEYKREIKNLKEKIVQLESQTLPYADTSEKDLTEKLEKAQQEHLEKLEKFKRKLWLKEITLITLQYYWCSFFSPVSQQHQTIRPHKKTRLTNSNIKKPNSSNIYLSNEQKFIYNLIINKKENKFFTDPQVSYYFCHLSP